MNDSNSSLCVSGLDPNLSKLGVMVGALSSKAGSPDTVCLQEAWFEDPIGHSAEGIKQDPGNFVALLTSLLGEVGGKSMGIPTKDPALLGTWSPIPLPTKAGEAATAQPILHVVTYTKDDATVIGLGVLHRWYVKKDGATELTVEAWGLLPLLALRQGALEVAIGQEGYPFTLGVAAEGPLDAKGEPSKPLVQAGAISFNGVKLSLNLDAAASSSPLTVGIEVLALQLPGEEKPSNRSLAELEEITAQEWIATGANLLIAALVEATGADPRGPLAYLLSVVGLSPAPVPGGGKALPMLAWDRLLEAATSGGDPAAPFVDWFRTLASDPALLQSWLSAIAGLMGHPITGGIEGTGSRTDPFAAPLVSIGDVGVLTFTLATTVDPKGARSLYPGIGFEATKVDLGELELTMHADLELAQFVLSGSSIGIGGAAEAIRLDAGLTLAGKGGAPLLELQSPKYGIGELTARLSIVPGGRFVPSLALTEVVTPERTFDTLDLLDPGELAKAAESTVASAIESGLKQLLGIASGSAAFGDRVAVLIGMDPPPGSWPLVPPLSSDPDHGLFANLQDPIGALGRYYREALKLEPVDGVRPFTALLSSLVGLLGTDSVAVAVSGGGTVESPWVSEITAGGQGLPAHLVAWEVPGEGGSSSLVIALRLSPTFALGSVQVTPRLTLELFDFFLPAAGGVWAAWAPTIEGALVLSGSGAGGTAPLQTPAVAGASLQVSDASLSAGWRRGRGWQWSIEAGAPALVVDGEVAALGARLSIGDETSLEELVRKDAKTFGPILLGILGVAALRSKTRPGALLTAWLGLLDAVSATPTWPTGFEWPKGIPGIDTAQLFTDPRPALAARLEALLLDPAHAKAALALLSWALSDGTTAPAIDGELSRDQPLRTPLPGGFQLLTWKGTAPDALGLGLGRLDVHHPDSEVQVTVEARLDAFELSLTELSIADAGTSLGLSVTIESPKAGTPLAEHPSIGSVDAIVLGFQLVPAAAGITVGLVAEVRGVTVAGGKTYPRLGISDLAQGSPAVEQILAAMINLAVDAAGQALSKAKVPAFATAYELLTLLGLATPRPNDEGVFGVNADGWRALLSDPGAYMERELVVLLVQPGPREKLFDLLLSALQIELPPVPESARAAVDALLAVLEIVGVVGPRGQGYPLLPGAVLELVRHPLQSLRDRFALLADKSARERLIGQLPVTTAEGKVGPVSLSLATGSIEAQMSWTLAEVLGLSSTVTLNLVDLTLEVAPTVGLVPLHLALAPSFGVTYVAGATGSAAFTERFEVDVVFGDGSRPAAEPLRIYPFDTEGDHTFLDQVAVLAPGYALDVLVGGILSSSLTQQYPLAQIGLEGLGIAQPAPGGGWEVVSMLGLFRDPLGWLLSDEVLGVDGRFDIGSLRKVFGRLTTAAAHDGGKWTTANGLTVTPEATTLALDGLPYGFGVFLEADTVLGFGIRSSGIDIASGTAQVDQLSVELTIDEAVQVGVKGGIRLSVKAGDLRPFVDLQHHDSFTLAIGTENDQKQPTASLAILPFAGFGALLEEGARVLAPRVIETVVPKLVAKLSASTNPTVKKLGDEMSTLGTTLHLDQLIDALAAADPFTAEGMEKAAMAWLMARLQSTPDDTAKALASLLEIPLGTTAITTEGGLVVYAPSPSLPLRLLVGADATISAVGVWAEVDLPKMKSISASVQRTGVGVTFAGDVVFSLGANLTVLVEEEPGPSLSLAYDQGKVAVYFDPMKATIDGKADALKRELLPNFFGQQPGDTGKAVLAWLEQISIYVLPRYVSMIVLNVGPVHGWLTSPILGAEGGPPPYALMWSRVAGTPGKSVLIYTGAAPNQKFALVPLDVLLSIEPTEFLGHFLKTLLETTIRFHIGDAGGLIEIGPKSEGAESFGLRVELPDLATASIPNVVLQLGAKDAAWIDESGWTDDKQPGISVYIPFDGLTPKFGSTELDIINVGIDIQGKGKPLVDTTRFKLGAIEPRVLFHLDFSTGKPSFGGAVRVADMQLSLAPSTLVAGSNSNPVAQNILGSGSSEGSTPPQAPAKPGNPPADPSFSVTAGYGGRLFVLLESNTGNGHEVIVPVERTFGPLYVGSVGLGWEDGPRRLDVEFTGALTLVGLELAVQGLRVGVPVTTPTKYEDYTLGLDGLDLSFKGGPVEINGGFLRSGDPPMYTGELMVKAASFSLGAIGSFGIVPTSEKPDAPKVPSLFIFGALLTPLGGPGAFFVTGVAAGFSVNRSLEVPSIGKVQDFPLITGLNNGSFSAGQSPESALVAINEIVKPEVGQFWLAAGLRFTTYELLQSSALLFVQFGRSFEIDLVGLSEASFPPGLTTPADALAFVQLAFKVTINPTVGFVSVEAQLTPNSFVLSRDCHLTGGFAFYLWFKDIEGKDATTGKPYRISAGDFVISLGGYHPRFQAPVYYPKVPRLGFSWIIEAGPGKLDIEGGAYFALVPTAIMAGGYLNVVFTMGPLRAWLEAAADFLIEWKPLFYVVNIRVSIGASLSTTILGARVTLTVELGANLHLEGPPTAGYAKVHWTIFSFTIPFGDTKSVSQNNLDWDQFQRSMLPAPSEASSSDGSPLMRAALVEADGGPYQPDDQQVLKAVAQDGQVGADGEVWLVRPVPFSVRFESSIPMSTCQISDLAVIKGSDQVGIRPMGLETPLLSPLTVTLAQKVTDAGGTTTWEEVPLQEKGLRAVGVSSAAPCALWSQAALDRNNPPATDELVLADTLLSSLLKADRYLLFGTAVKPFAILALAYDKGTARLPFADLPRIEIPSENPDQAIALQKLMATVASTAVTRRNEVLASLRAGDLEAPASPDLSVMASSARDILQAPPVLAAIGVFQVPPGTLVEGAVKRSTPPPVAELMAEPRAAAPAPVLLGIRRTHQAADGRRVVVSWQDQTRGRARRRQALTLARSASGSQGHALQPGTLALLAVAPDGDYELSSDGELGTRVVCFADSGRMLSDALVPAGATASLHAGTQHLAIEGQASGDELRVGWTRDTMLTRANGSVALGNGVAVRTQNSRRLLRVGTSMGRGVVDAAELLDQNWVQSAKGEVPGWIHTHFTAAPTFVEVVFESPSAHPQARLSVELVRSEAPFGVGHRRIEPRSLHSEGGRHRLVYAVPEGPGYVSVVVRPLSPEDRVVGVLAADAGECGHERDEPRVPGVDPKAARTNACTVRVASRATR